MNKGLPITRRGLLSAGGCAGVGLTLPPLFSGCDNTPQASGTVYQTRMNLTAEERDQLEGGQGPTMKKIMETLCNYGDVFGATNFVPLDQPIHSVASFALLFLGPMFDIMDELKREGYKTTMPFTANPRPTDYDNVDVGALESASFGVMFPGQSGFENDLRSLGMRTDKPFSCGCYQPEVGNLPGRGDIMCWSESSAVSFANSVLGARTNRNSGITDFFMGILGKTPYFGLLTDEGRRATWTVDIRTSKKPDSWVLGAAIGGAVRGDVPYIRGLDQWIGSELNEENKSWLKDFGAAGASNGAIGLYHVDNLTPEAKDYGESLVKSDARTLVVDDAMLNATVRSFETTWRTGSPELCIIGCPHNSLYQLNEWTGKIEDALSDARRSRVAVKTILVAAPQTIDKFKQDRSTYNRLMATGAEVGSMCALMHCQNPLISGQRILTNSSKLRHYSSARYAPAPVVLNAAVTGGM